MSFHRFSEQKSIWNLSLQQIILLESIGCPRNTVWTLEHVLSQQTFEHSRWTWLVQTTFVATDGCAAWKVLIRRSSFLSGIAKPVRSNLGDLIVTHKAIQTSRWKKHYVCFELRPATHASTQGQKCAVGLIWCPHAFFKTKVWTCCLLRSMALINRFFKFVKQGQRFGVCKWKYLSDINTSQPSCLINPIIGVR